MRLVCHLNAADIAALQSGKVMMLSLIGMDGLTLHFDPDPGESVEQAKQENPLIPTVEIEEPVAVSRAVGKTKSAKPGEIYQCSHCPKAFPTRRGWKKHLEWVDRLAKVNSSSVNPET